MRCDYVFDPGESVCRSVTTDALVVDSIFVSMSLKQVLQLVGVTTTRNTCGQAVSKRDNGLHLPANGGWC